jgi:hypothetical protein
MQACGGDSLMQTVFITFLSQADRVRGYYELATRSHLRSLPGAIYKVPMEALKLLEDQRIGYRRMLDAEVTSSHDAE